MTAMIAARMANMRVGNPNLNKQSPIGATAPIAEISQTQAAKLMGISRDVVKDAKVVLDEGTPEEIQLLESGKSGAKPIADNIRQRIPRDRSKDIIGRPQAKSVVAANRVSTWNAHAKLYANMKEALILLSGLPRPSDMVMIARKVERGGLIDAKLFLTIQWLKEFSNEWSKRNQTDGNGEKSAVDGNNPVDAGTGDETTGSQRA